MKFFLYILMASLPFFSACKEKRNFYKNPPQVSKRLLRVMELKKMHPSSPLMIRIFKKEMKLEVWKQTYFHHYDMLAHYNICKYSGNLGPKLKEGDRQSPEGFYKFERFHLNPFSRYHLSFNIGFPNAYDRAHGRTGRHLMVHGGCASVGCYSMTNLWIEEIYALVHQAFKGGQKEIQIHIFPFRMTESAMMPYKDNENYEFWKELKEGYDHFENMKTPPDVKIDFCEKRYVFNNPDLGICSVLDLNSIQHDKNALGFIQEDRSLQIPVPERKPE